MKKIAVICCISLFFPYLALADAIDDDIERIPETPVQGICQSDAQFFLENPSASNFAKGMWWEEIGGAAMFGGLVLAATISLWINHSQHNHGDTSK